MSEIRHNLLKNSYVIMAPERMHRPAYNMAWKKDEPSASSCPFCEGNESMTPTEIYAVRDNKSLPDKPGWKSRVVPNLYKAVQVEAQYHSRQEGIYNAWDGFGAHEIIIDTPQHLDCMTEWKSSTFLIWLKTLQARIKDLRQDERIAFISIFKNHGLLHFLFNCFSCPENGFRLGNIFFGTFSYTRFFIGTEGNMNIAGIFDECCNNDMEGMLFAIVRLYRMIVYVERRCLLLPQVNLFLLCPFFQQGNSILQITFHA